MKFVEVSKRDQELWAMPTIESVLPLRFDSGKFTLCTFVGHCSQCRRDIQGTHFRGSLVLVLPNVARLEAVGLCTDCKLLSRYAYRVHDDGSMTGLRDGHWCRWKSKGENRYWALLKSFARLLYGLATTRRTDL